MGLKSFLHRELIEAGCDEAGRGCLAGPVVAAAVVLPKHFRNPALNDSKKLTLAQRNALRIEIERKALSYAVAFIEPEHIDRINILNASFLAMHEAVRQLTITPEHLLIDGNRFNPFEGIPHTCIIKGDGKFHSIAAASVLAKTYRDAYMEEQHARFPHYCWDSNKGYPTVAHREAIRIYGSCELHRKSFTLLSDEQLALF